MNFKYCSSILVFIDAVLPKNLSISYVFLVLYQRKSVHCFIIIYNNICGVEKHVVNCLFLCSFMLGSYSANDGAQLYMIDPSGVSYVSTR